MPRTPSQRDSAQQAQTQQQSGGQHSEEAGSEPTAVGGRTIGVPAEAMRYDRSRDVVILDMNALTTLDNFCFPFGEARD